MKCWRCAISITWGYQAAGAALIVLGHRVSNPETIASAIGIGNPASWVPALEVIHESLGDIRAVTDDEILDAYRYAARYESIFCEPASPASLDTASRRTRPLSAYLPATD